MKKIIFLLLVSISCFSQKAVYNKITNSGKFSEYQTKEGSVLKIGDSITIGYPLGKEFTFITQGDLSVGAHLSNVKIVVSQIKSVGKPIRGYKTYIYFKGHGYNVAIDYEAALESGEIKDPFFTQ